MCKARHISLKIFRYKIKKNKQQILKCIIRIKDLHSCKQSKIKGNLVAGKKVDSY